MAEFTIDAFHIRVAIYREDEPTDEEYEKLGDTLTEFLYGSLGEIITTQIQGLPGLADASVEIDLE